MRFVPADAPRAPSSWRAQARHPRLSLADRKGVDADLRRHDEAAGVPATFIIGVHE
jgi:hypothetical protein